MEIAISKYLGYDMGDLTIVASEFRPELRTIISRMQAQLEIGLAGNQEQKDRVQGSVDDEDNNEESDEGKEQGDREEEPYQWRALPDAITITVCDETGNNWRCWSLR